MSKITDIINSYKTDAGKQSQTSKTAETQSTTKITEIINSYKTDVKKTSGNKSALDGKANSKAIGANKQKESSGSFLDWLAGTLDSLRDNSADSMLEPNETTPSAAAALKQAREKSAARKAKNNAAAAEVESKYNGSANTSGVKFSDATAADSMFGDIDWGNATDRGRLENVLFGASRGYTADNLKTLSLLMSDEANKVTTTADAFLGTDATLTDELPIVKKLKAKISEWASGKSDEYRTESSEAVTMAKKNLGTVGSMAVDTGVAAVQMAYDVGLGALTKTSALVPMASRSFGGGLAEAEESGATGEKAFGYALGSAAVEVLTEKIGNIALPFAKAYGAGAIDDVIRAAIEKKAKTEAGAQALKLLVAMISEGGEEVISGLLNPILKATTYDAEAIKDFGKQEFWDDLLEQFAVGAALAGLGSSVDIISGVSAKSNPALSTNEGQLALVESGLESAEGTESRRLAEEYKKKLDAGHQLTKREIRKLTKANEAAISEEAAKETKAEAERSSEIWTSAEAMFDERGEDASPELLSGVTKLITEGTLTEEETRAIQASDNSAEVVQQLAQEYIRQEAPEVLEPAPVDGPMELWDQDNIVESMSPNEVKSGILNEQYIADIQHFYDNSGRSIDLNELEAMVRDYIENKKEAKDNGGDNISDRIEGRDSNKSSGKQTSELAGVSERSSTSKQSRKAVSRQNSTADLRIEKISSKELGLKAGTDSKIITVLTEEALDDELKSVRKTVEEETGLSVKFVLGAINIKGLDGDLYTVRGAYTGKEIIVQADNLRATARQIAEHEIYHWKAKNTPGLNSDIKQAIIDDFGEKELRKIIEKYIQRHRSIIDISEDSSGEEVETAIAKILEEVFADAYAGINQFGAGKFTETVNSTIDSKYIGKRSQQDNGTKETRGPPAGDQYSVDVDISTYITPEAISEAKINVANMAPVAHLTGEEFAKKEGLRFSDQLNDFFNSFGNVLYSNRIGEVIANENSVDSDIAHGVFRKKSIAAAAIPEVLRDGEIIDYQVNYDNRTYDTMCIAAPITIAGERYFEGIIVRRIEGTDRFYTHDILIEKDEAPTFKAGGIDDTNTGVRASIISLLKQVNEVNRKNAETQKTSKNISGADDISADPVTYDGNVIPLSERFNVDNEDIRYSVDDNLEYELYEVYNGTFDSSRNEVHIGTTSNFMTGVIGAEGLDLFMPAEKAYRAMKTEKQAVFEGKPTGENINYHGLGVDGLIEILNASEKPIAAFVDTPSAENKRENRIVLVTDVKADGGLGVVIEEVDTFALKDGKRIKANKSITVYPKNNVSSTIREAIADNRILYLDEKRSQAHLPIVKGANYPTVGRKADFTNNIRRFWENVKWKKSGRTELTFDSDIESEPDWKTKLREFNTDDSEDVYSLTDERRVEKEKRDERIIYYLFRILNEDYASNQFTIGEFTNFITDAVGEKSIKLNVSTNAAYKAIVSEERAIYEGKKTSKKIHYLDLGANTVADIIKKSEEPVVAYIAEKGEQNPGNRLILVTNKNTKIGLGCVNEIIVFRKRDGQLVGVKEPTAIPKDIILEEIIKAHGENRIVHLDNNKFIKVFDYDPSKFGSTEGFQNNLKKFYEIIKPEDVAAENENTSGEEKQNTSGEEKQSLPDEMRESIEEAFREGVGATDNSANSEWALPEGYENIDEYTAEKEKRKAEMEKQAEREKQKRTRNKTRDEFDGTPALQKLGVKVEGSVANYRSVEALKGASEARRTLSLQRMRAERRLRPTAKEKLFASKIAEGILDSTDITASMDADKILEYAEFLGYERAMGYDPAAERRKEINAALDEKVEQDWQDKPEYNPRKFKAFSKLAMNERQPERVMHSIFGQKDGTKLYNDYFHTVETNEAERLRFVNRMLDSVREFDDATGKKRKLTPEEDELAQKVKEGQAIKETVERLPNNKIIKQAAEDIRKTQPFKTHENAKARTEARRDSTLALIKQLTTYSLNGEERELAIHYARYLDTEERLKDADTTIIGNAVKAYEEHYNDFYDAINDFLVAHGYQPIPFRKDYAPHMQNTSVHDSLLGTLKNLGVNQEVVTSLSAEIAGRTADFKPNMKYNPYFQNRKGSYTEYSITKGFESYVSYMSDMFYHTDDIMRLRRAEQHIRKMYASEEIQNNIETANSMRYASLEEKAVFLAEKRSDISSPAQVSAANADELLEEYIASQYDNARNNSRFSEFVTWLDNYINMQAGKQSYADRGLEYSGGREFLNFGNKLMRRFSETNIGGNISTVLNQFAQLPLVTNHIGAKYAAKAIKDLATGEIRRASFMEKSDHLTGKEGINWVTIDNYDRFMNLIFTPAEFADRILNVVAVRGEYLRMLDKGLSEAQAMKEADAFGRRVMGSRMKGVRPQGFESKRFVSRMLHVFQLEAANTVDYAFISTLPTEIKNTFETEGKAAGARKLSATIVGYLIFAFLLNRLDDELYGGTPVPFDLLGITATFFAEGHGLTANAMLKTIMDNGLERLTGERLFGTEDSESEFDLSKALAGVGYDITNDIPYLSNMLGVLGWGDNTLPTIGVSEAYDELKTAIKALKGNDEEETTADINSAIKHTLFALSQFVPGGRQFRKTYQGIEAVFEGGKYTGTGENKRLQYAVDWNLLKAAQAILFGTGALSENSAYYASDSKPLSPSQTRAYEELVEHGADRMEVYNAILEYRRASGDSSLSAYERGVEQRNAITSSDISDGEKLELYRKLSNADSRAEHFDTVMNAGLSWTETVDVYDKYAAIDSDEDADASSKALEFAVWLDSQSYTDKQKKIIKEEFKYWMMMPAKAESYEKLSSAGLSAGTSKEVTDTLNALQPDEGKEQVTQKQKVLAVLNMSIPETDKDKALGAIYGANSDKAYERYRTAIANGLTSEEYAWYLEIADANENGHITQDEFKTAANTIGMSTEAYNALWKTYWK